MSICYWCHQILIFCYFKLTNTHSNVRRCYCSPNIFTILYEKLPKVSHLNLLHYRLFRRCTTSHCTVCTKVKVNCWMAFTIITYGQPVDCLILDQAGGMSKCLKSPKPRMRAIMLICALKCIAIAESLEFSVERETALLMYNVCNGQGRSLHFPRFTFTSH